MITHRRSTRQHPSVVGQPDPKGARGGGVKVALNELPGMAVP